MDNEITELKVNFVELKTDISYIKDMLVDNNKQHEDIKDALMAYMKQTDKRLDNKADRTDCEQVKRWLIGGSGAVITILITVIGFLINKLF